MLKVKEMALHCHYTAGYIYLSIQCRDYGPIGSLGCTKVEEQKHADQQHCHGLGSNKLRYRVIHSLRHMIVDL